MDEQVLHHHEVMLLEALDLYDTWELEPFHVIDVEMFYYNEDPRQAIRALSFQHILGHVVYHEAKDGKELISKEVAPYLLIAAGLGFGVPFLNFDPNSLFSLYEERYAKRCEWLQSQTVTLDKVEPLAMYSHEYHRMRHVHDEIQYSQKQAWKKYYHRRAYRWEPYVARVLIHDPVNPQPVVMSSVVRASSQPEMQS